MAELARLATTALRAALAPPIDIIDAAELRLRVALGDLDPFGNVTNARHLHYLDLGRLDFVIRAGWMRNALSRRATYRVGAVTIRYRRPLRWKERVEVSSRVLTWDDKWLYFEQHLSVDGEERAVSRSKVQFRGAGTVVAPRDLAELSSHITPPRPAAAVDFA